jgi:hypothetical protein
MQERMIAISEKIKFLVSMMFIVLSGRDVESLPWG